MSEEDWVEGYRQALDDIMGECKLLRRLSIVPAWEATEATPDGKEGSG